MEGEIVEIKTEPRKVWKALLLSLLALGLGQVYNGQIKKCLILWACLIFIPIIFAITKLLTLFHGWILLCVILIGLQLYAIVDACVSARLRKIYIPKKYNKWHFYAVFGLIIYAAFGLIRRPTSAISSVRTFKIPMEANAPTLQIGDNIVADMRAYRNTDPDYGDIVIFNMGGMYQIFQQ